MEEQSLETDPQVVHGIMVSTLDSETDPHMQIKHLIYNLIYDFVYTAEQ